MGVGAWELHASGQLWAQKSALLVVNERSCHRMLVADHLAQAAVRATKLGQVAIEIAVGKVVVAAG